jgi:hypothetical protein
VERIAGVGGGAELDAVEEIGRLQEPGDGVLEAEPGISAEELGDVGGELAVTRELVGDERAAPGAAP